MFRYKCPLCNNDMQFDSKHGILTCCDCNNSISITNVCMPEYGNENFSSYKPELANTNTNITSDDDFDTIDTKVIKSDFAEKARLFICSKCEAELIEHSGAASIKCPFCGTNLTSSSNKSGNNAPAKIIPFKVTESTATAIFAKWCHKNHFTPSGFKKSFNERGLSAVYIPVWRYELYGCGELEGVGAKIKDTNVNDNRTTITDYYNIYRKNDYKYSNVIIPSSTKLSASIINNLGKYSFDNTEQYQAFNKTFISENCAYNNDSAAANTVISRRNQIMNTMENSVKEYSSFCVTSNDSRIQQIEACYTLVPVWMFSYKYMDTNHNFYLNGETGIVTGKPPLSIGKFAACTIALGLLLFCIILCILYITGIIII